MTETERWNKTCLKKAKLTEKTANKIISMSKVKLYKYRCPYCFGWHLTRKEQKK